MFFQVAVSTSHIVALTSELLVFTWGDGRRGQLGHGELETWRSRPEAVESLKARISERMRCDESAIIIANIAHIPHIRQNHLTFPLISTKTNSQKVVSNFWQNTYIPSTLGEANKDLRLFYPSPRDFKNKVIHFLHTLPAEMFEGSACFMM